MIDVKIKDKEIENKSDIIKRASLEVSVMNAPYGPYLKRGDKYPYKLRNFLPKELFQKKEVTEDEKTKNWLAAGNEMMEVVEQHKRDTKNIKNVRR